jgi:cytochrome oxidase assembly protein ShyY1
VSTSGATTPATGTRRRRPRPTELRAAIALVRERGWALALVGVVALSVVFVLLGRWQYERHAAKVERRDRIAANYDATPVPLRDVLAGPNQQLDPAREWTPVTVTGQYRAESTVLVRNRPLDGRYGFEVLVPLQQDDGRVLLVDRGWVPNGTTGAERPDAVPPPPLGSVEVTVRLRPGEPGLDRTPPAGQQLRIDLPRIADQLGDPLGSTLYPAYGVLSTERPAGAAGLQLLPRPSVGLGINLAYAIQWWAFAVAAYLVLNHYLLREVRRRAGTTAPVRRRSVDEEYEDRLNA